MSQQLLAWPLLLWTFIWVLFALVSGWLRDRLLRKQDHRRLYGEVIPWIYGLAPPFLAWVFGWMPARVMGFSGQGGLIGWLLISLLLALSLALYWRFIRPRLPAEIPDIRSEHALLDEPRWAFYRGVGWLWLGQFGWGMLLGFGLSLLEWALRHEIWRVERRSEPATCFHLARHATSSLVFALSANLWLTMLFQAGLLLSMEESPLESGSPT
ncbi:MAG: hypothetical protein ACLFWD_06160 [Anaerolineales bacterium]